MGHGDIIPHDHDGDIIIKNQAHRNFLMGNINEFPDDIGIYDDKTRFKIFDANGCMENILNEPKIGPFIDLIIAETDGPFYFEQFTGGIFSWKWDDDSMPIQYSNVRGFDWPLPSNWAKAMAGDFHAGRPVYTYVPMKLDE